MPPTVIEVHRARPRVRVVMSAGAGTVLVPRLLDRTADSARLALVAGGAMLLGGDSLDVRITVGDGCRLEIIEVGGTVAYGGGEPGRAAGPCRWTVTVAVGTGATLVWSGREVIVSDGADLTRVLRMELAVGACALLRETTVLGRAGESGGSARLITVVDYDGVPLLAEDTEFAGDAPMPGVLDGSRVFDTVLLAGRRPSAVAGASELDGPGALARHLGDELHLSPLGELWDAWRFELAADDDRVQGAR